MKKFSEIYNLIDSYDAILFDALGVLIYNDGPVEGAKELIDYLKSIDKRFLILTNDSSKLLSTTVIKYKNYNLDINENSIITSGSLLKEYFIKKNYKSKKCVVMGLPDSITYVKNAGGKVLSYKESLKAELFIICNQIYTDFIVFFDNIISALIHKIENNIFFELILTNPDFLYPKIDNNFGITSGAIALLIENILEKRYPDKNIKFTKLGKPYSFMFEAAEKKLGTKNLIMIGDQLDTDIKGANDYGIDSALVLTGLTNLDKINSINSPSPTFILESLKK